MNRRFVSSLLCCAAAVFTGCTQQRFTLGMYDASRASLPKLKQAGFDVVTMRAAETDREAFLKAARTNRLGVILAPNLNGAPARGRTSRHDKHPALWAWSLADEPDLNGISPDEMRRKKRVLRETARKPTYVTVASGAALEKYRHCADYLAVDWYPVPWTPVATVSREMRSARLAGRDRRFFAVLQAFDWRAFPGLIEGGGVLRAPTPEELKCMSYLALFHGASGLFFYSFDTTNWKLDQNSELWQTVTNLAAEAKTYSAMFNNRVDWWPAETRYEEPAEMYNEIHEGSVAVNLFHVRKSAGRVKRGYYVVAINTSGREVTFGFREPFAERRWIEREFAPFEVLVHGPIFPDERKARR